MARTENNESELDMESEIENDTEYEHFTNFQQAKNELGYGNMSEDEESDTDGEEIVNEETERVTTEEVFGHYNRRGIAIPDSRLLNSERDTGIDTDDEESDEGDTEVETEDEQEDERRTHDYTDVQAITNIIGDGTPVSYTHLTLPTKA